VASPFDCSYLIPARASYFLGVADKRLPVLATKDDKLLELDISPQLAAGVEARELRRRLWRRISVTGWPKSKTHRQVSFTRIPSAPPGVEEFAGPSSTPDVDGPRPGGAVRSFDLNPRRCLCGRPMWFAYRRWGCGSFVSARPVRRSTNFEELILGLKRVTCFGVGLALLLCTASATTAVAAPTAPVRVDPSPAVWVETM
jgi:hypothetical protein